MGSVMVSESLGAAAHHESAHDGGDSGNSIDEGTQRLMTLNGDLHIRDSCNDGTKLDRCKLAKLFASPWLNAPRKCQCGNATRDRSSVCACALRLCPCTAHGDGLAAVRCFVACFDGRDCNPHCES